MPAYAYRARDPSGKITTGVLAASSPAEVAARLRDDGRYVSEVREVAESTGRTAEGRPFVWPWRRINGEQLLNMYVELADMVGSGLPILTALDMLVQQTASARLKEALNSVRQEVSAGKSFSQALAGHPEIFPPLFVRSVEAGETSGRLGDVLAGLASYAERSFDLRKKVQGALLYPAILLGAGLVVVLGVVTYVLPNFVEIFQKAGVPLPVPTKIMYGVGVWIKRQWYLIPAAIAAVVTAVRLILSTPGGALAWDRLLLRLPVFGPLCRKAAIARVCRTLSMMTASGVPLLGALAGASAVAGNRVVGAVLDDARTAVSDGSRISQAIASSGEFPPDVIQMLAVSEETGNIDGMLQTVASFYEKGVDRAVKKLMTVLEPVILVILGGVVGMIMASILLPMLDMAKAIRSMG